MLHYPKIPGSRNCPNGPCIAFEKYDGTNLHWDWDRDFGFHAFGTRRDAFNLTPEGIAKFVAAHPNLKGCVEVFQATLASALEAILGGHANYQAFTSAKVFTEYLGPNSFAGLHKINDPMTLVLIDVLVEPFGMVGPEPFVADFGHLQSARVVFKGKLTGKFAEEVRTGKFGVTEGVVCKGGKGGSDFWIVKIKTNAYMQKLKQAFGDKWEDYWE